MKKLLLPFLLIFNLVAHAASVSSSGFHLVPITITGGSYHVSWGVIWSCDDYPRNSAPGRIELLDGAGNILGRASASIYHGSGPQGSSTLGSLSDLDGYVSVWCPSGAPADGELTAIWHITGVPDGNYQLRLWAYNTFDNGLHATNVWTSTQFYGSAAPANAAPTITWDSAPAAAANGQNYFIAARAHDNNGNLAQVNVWKNGTPFAFAGGGNGTDGDSGNWTSDSGPQSVTFTAQAVDSDGATSPVITHVVTINAPVNNPPSVTLLSPGSQTVTSGTTLTISSHATDPDGNLTNHNLDIQRPDGAWNFEAGFAVGEPFQGGPVGSGGNSTRSASFTFTDIGTYYVRSAAADSSGWYHSNTIAITVVPANHAPSVQWVQAPASANHQQSYTVAARGSDSDGNLSQVNVWKNGQPFAFAGGGNGWNGDSGNPSNDSGPQTITFTAQAVDASGATSPVITHTVTINAPVNHAPNVTLLAPGAQTIPSGTTLTLTGHATDSDGNLTNHNLDIQRPDGAWNFEGGFATGEPYQGGPVGSGGNSTRSASLTFIDVGTYRVRSAANDGSGWYYSSTVEITVVPANQPPTIAWTNTPGTVNSGQAYLIAAHGHDSDGNLNQVRIWKNGATFATAGASGADGDANGSSTDTGPASITYTAQAFDTAGAVSATISQTVTINPPPPAQYTLITIAAAGGIVSAGGVFVDGNTTYVTASPDAAHDFAGWSGDAAGTANPVGVLMDRNKSVQANFSPKTFTLVTSTSGGGGVSPGGTYPYGTTVTIIAIPDATHRFTGWAGDASGNVLSVTLTVTRALSVQALFELKTAQTISFPAINDQSVGASFPLNITSSSGLPVNVLVTGPASYAAGVLTVTGPGAVSIEATQPGDGTYLAAAPVNRSFNAATSAILKYRAMGRTLLQTGRPSVSIPYILQPNP